VQEPGDPVEAPVETPLETEPAGEDYVEVQYETEAPKITEKETGTGKVITVSSEESLECSSLKYQLQQLQEQTEVQESPISYSNILTSSLASLSNAVKFLVADIEQAIEVAVETVSEIINPPEVVEEPIEEAETPVEEITEGPEAAAEPTESPEDIQVGEVSVSVQEQLQAQIDILCPEMTNV
jgi:hypothetical protein